MVSKAADKLKNVNAVKFPVPMFSAMQVYNPLGRAVSVEKVCKQTEKH